MATMQERLAEYETLFADRYTEKDAAYQKHIAMKKRPAPVVPDWLGGWNAGHDHFRRRNDDRRRGNDRGWDNRSDYDRRGDRGDNRRDYQRDRYGGGSGGGRRDYRERGPRDHHDNKHDVQYKSCSFYEMYY